MAERVKKIHNDDRGGETFIFGYCHNEECRSVTFGTIMRRGIPSDFLRRSSRAPLVVSNSILVTTLAPLGDYLPACI